MYRVHNSTVSRQLRYALTKERLCCMAVTPATYAPCADRLPVLLKNTKQFTLTAQHQEPHTSMHWTSLQHYLSE